MEEVPAGRPGQLMRTGLLDIQARLVLDHPRLVVAAAILAGLLALYPVARLPVRTARIDLLPADDADVRAFLEFDRIFGAVHTVFLVVDGAPVEARRFVDAASTALRATPGVRAVTGRLDIDSLRAGALRARPTAELSRLAAQMDQVYPVLRRVLADPSPTIFLKALAEEVNDPETPAPSIATALGTVRSLDDFAVAVRSSVDPTLPATSAVFPSFDIAAQERARRGLDAAGYLASKSGRRLLMMISPAAPPDDPVRAAALLAELRTALVPALQRWPTVQVSFGGAPVQDVLEEATVKRDMVVTSVWAGVVVLALSLLAFRDVVAGILANLVMGFSIYLTMAFAYLLVGHLNVISSVFAAVLVGVGIDFGIYLFQLYLDALPRYGPDAMRHALVTGSPGILTGAITPAAAFFSLVLHRFPAFHELGLIAGAGMVIALVSMLVLFPALVVIGGARFQRLASLPPSRLGSVLVRSTRGGARTIPILAVIAVLGLACVPAAPFDYDIGHLQAASAESSQAEAALRSGFGLSSDFIMLRSPDLETAHRMVEKLSRVPEVGFVDGATSLVPAPSTMTSTPVVHILELGRGLGPAAAHATSPLDTAALVGALDEATSAVQRLRDLAREGESRALAEAVDGVARDLREAGHAFRSAAPPEAAKSMATLSARMAGELARFRLSLEEADRSPPLTLATLPVELKARYVGRDGSLATYVWAARDISSPAQARGFVAALQGLDAPMTGTPVLVCRMLDMIRNGFAQAALLALAIIVVLVLMDVRRATLAVAGLLPMGCGTVVGIACLSLSGGSWNPVNSMALPVMLGEGVGFGVNLVHRWLAEGRVEAAVAGTGRAVVYAAATSITGFGSLMLAQHRGLRSFGMLLAMGTFAELVVSVLVLPRVLGWLRTTGALLERP